MAQSFTPRPLPAPFADLRAFGVHTPENYGAVGNGTTDDYAAIIAAYNAAPEGGELLFLGKKYAMSQTWVVDKCITVRGAWGKTNTANSASGSRLTPTSAAVQQGMSRLIHIKASYSVWRNIVAEGRGYTNGANGFEVGNTEAVHAHQNEFHNCFGYGWGHGFMHGAWSDHTMIYGGKFAGNLHGLGIAVDNHHDFMHTGVLFDGNVEASVHLLAGTTSRNVTFMRCHMGFGKYGILQDATATGNGAVGWTLIDTPIESVSVQHIKLSQGGNIRIQGGYWLWSGTPANPAFEIDRVQEGPIWFSADLESQTPNPNSPALIRVNTYTAHKIQVEVPLNGFAVAVFAGQFRDNRVTRITTSTSYTVPAGVYRLRVGAVGSGGGGGGGGSALTSGGVTGQVGGGAGAAGSYAEVVLDVLPGQVYNTTIQSGGSSGTGGAVNGNPGTPGTNGGNTTFTGPGGTVFAKGGARGLGSAANSTVQVAGGLYGAQAKAAPIGFEGAGSGGGSSLAGGDPYPGPLCAAGGGGGGPATATNGGGAGVSGTNGGGAAGASGASGTAAGVDASGAFGYYGAGGAGGGGGAPGGKGGNAAGGTLGAVFVEAIG